MLAIDSNVVVRLPTGDDPEPAARARALPEGSRVFVALTVMPEAERVLRSAYGLECGRVVEALEGPGHRDADDGCRAIGSPSVREPIARAPQGAPDSFRPAG